MSSSASPRIPKNPVLEITLLTATSSSTPSLILTQLQNVRTLLAEKVLPTHSKFYHSTASNEIYILGFWPSLRSHTDFLADEKLCEEILSPQEEVLDWRWTGHIALSNETVNEVREKIGTVEVVEIERWIVEVSQKDAFLKELSALDSLHVEDEGLGRVVVAQGWAVNSSAYSEDATSEYIRIRGWKTLENMETASVAQRDSVGDILHPKHQQGVNDMAQGLYIDME